MPSVRAWILASKTSKSLLHFLFDASRLVALNRKADKSSSVDFSLDSVNKLRSTNPDFVRVILSRILRNKLSLQAHCVSSEIISSQSIMAASAVGVFGLSEFSLERKVRLTVSKGNRCEFSGSNIKSNGIPIAA